MCSQEQLRRGPYDLKRWGNHHDPPTIRVREGNAHYEGQVRGSVGLLVSAAAVGTLAATNVVFAMLMFMWACSTFLSTVDQHLVAVDSQSEACTSFEDDLLRGIGLMLERILEDRSCHRMRFSHMPDIHKNTFATLMISLKQAYESMGLRGLETFLKTDVKIVVADTVLDALGLYGGLGSGSFHMTSQ